MKGNWFPVLLGIVIIAVVAATVIDEARKDKAGDEKFAANVRAEVYDSAWLAPSLYSDNETIGRQRAMVIYGQDLIAHTSKYFGPNGTIAHN